MNNSTKKTNTGHFDAIDDQTIGIRKFFEKIRLKRLLRPIRLQRPLRSMRLQWFLRPEKSLLRTSESSWFLNSIIWGLKYFSLMFWKTKVWQNHENSCWIFCWRLLRPAYVYFFENWWMKLKCHNLRNTQIPSNKIQLAYFYLSESI